VITLAGPQSEDILTSIFQPLGERQTAPENALQLGRLVDRKTGAVLDKAIVCRTPGGVEINIHGGPHVARRLLELLADLGARPQHDRTDPHGPLDASHDKWNNPAIGAELLSVLPMARSTLVIRALSSQWSSGLSELVAGPKQPEGNELRAAADGLEDIAKLLNPVEVVLAGPPNAGKSTLTNALVGREVSIVHQMAGTTRDWVREAALINGLPIWLTDTAGLWDAPKGVDSEAVSRARQCARRANIVIMLDPDAAPNRPNWLDPSAGAPKLLSVRTKCDQPSDSEPDGAMTISAMTGQGLEELKDAIISASGLNNFDPKTPRAFTTRQAKLLSAAADAIDAGNAAATDDALEQLLRGPINQS